MGTAAQKTKTCIEEDRHNLLFLKWSKITGWQILRDSRTEQGSAKKCHQKYTCILRVSAQTCIGPKRRNPCLHCFAPFLAEGEGIVRSPTMSINQFDMARKISGCPNLYLFKKSLRSFKILLHKGTNYKGRFFKMANETENSIHIFKVCFPDFFCLLHNNYFMINPVNILLELHFTVFEMLRFATFFIMPCSP